MRRGGAFLVALFLVAACLRSSITGVGPLLGTLREQLGLSATVAGFLSSLPLLMFATCAPLARLARNHGTERLLLAALVAMAAGILVRSEGQVVALFGGTLMLAGGIAVANVLLPILVKQHFPSRIPTITTAYATIMGFSAALGSALAAPLAGFLPGGWRASLVSWIVPVLLAGVAWFPHTRHDLHVTSDQDTPHPPLPWRSALAWQIAGYMGMQSLVFYVTVAWYPVMLRDGGMAVEAAGWLLTLYQLTALGGGLLMPVLIRRSTHQRGLAAATGLLSAVGTLGMLLAPQFGVVWMPLLGIGTGPALILALSFMGLRALNPRSAASLSLMGQSLGYLLAASGPVTFGFLHDLTGGWHWPMLFLAGTGAAMLVCGLGAGRAIRE
jgi:MFS transporter, CP family, cyanate transporter